MLNNVHQSLRDDGLLLIFQPEAEGQYVEVLIDDRVVFREQQKQPDFTRFVGATKSAIDHVLQEGLFARTNELLLPDQHSYESVDAWVENEGLEDPLTPDDNREVETMAARIRDLVKAREHSVLVTCEEYTVLLHKCD